MQDVCIIGAGPCGISAGVELAKRGIQPLIFEKGCIAHSIYHYPLTMNFFSTPDRLEIGEIPFISINERPTRREALKYFSTVAKSFNLDIRIYEEVIQIEKTDFGFTIHTQTDDEIHKYQTKFVVIATGYYDNPNLLNIPGEDLPHVHHYYRDSHPYLNQDVVVIGGRNSAIDVALDLYRSGVKVTMVYRKKEIHSSVKPWIKPVIETAIEKGRIQMYWGSEVKEIKKKSVVILQDNVVIEIPANVVFAMTGYKPKMDFVRQLGGKTDQHRPRYHPDNMETTIPGLYLAGVVATGQDSTMIFIENGRLHGKLIAEDIITKYNISKEN